MDDFLLKPQRRHVRHLNIVPILDMLTTVIFFLLLSTSFIQFTKLTVPPSQVSTITDPIAPPPLAPKLVVVKAGADLHRLILTWAGKEPGEDARPYRAATDPKKDVPELAALAGKMISDFHTKFPTEKSLQIGLGHDVEYQKLIAVMDGARENMPDIVLISYNEAESRARGTNGGLDAASH